MAREAASLPTWAAWWIVTSRRRLSPVPCGTTRRRCGPPCAPGRFAAGTWTTRQPAICSPISTPSASSRSPAQPKRPASFETITGATGEALFQAKGCSGCHQSGTALGRKIRGRTLTEIGAEMWNHAPRVSKAMKSAPPQFDTGEMRELLSYLWARQFFEDAGNAGYVKRVFAAKRCGACHGDASSGAPDLTAGARSFTGATMVSVLWRHGPAMLAKMRSKCIPWPYFQTHEMSDLIAYLNSGEKGKSRD